MKTINSPKKFTVKARVQSFKYAFAGIAYFLKTQHNAWIHLAAAVLVTTLGFICNLSTLEWCAVIFAIGFVLASEAFNTAIEMLVDMASPSFNSKAGAIKDIAAGAVLIAALTALVIGFLIFIPKIEGLMRN